MRRPLTSLLLGLAAFAAAFGPAAAREVTPAEKRIIPYVADIPTCGDPSVLARIATNFAEKETKFWGVERTIVEYEHIRPVAWRPWGLDTIPRRFCTATAIVSDGRRRRIDFSVREDLAFIGNGWGVEFCVQGYDNNWAYAPSCRMARP